MWITSVLAVASSVLSQLAEQYYHNSTNKYVMILLLLIMSIGFGGYQANIVLLGIDQLQDASTDEITSFISWYLFTYFSVGMIVQFIYTWLGQVYNELLQEFLIYICLTLMVISTLSCDQIFLKEPITQNPFMLIYKIIKYAIKTKHPRCRSAFTYCEDELPSRIDFGKRKYGGPFTTEEVENVKIFLRLIIIIFVGSTVASGALSLNNVEHRLISHSIFHFHSFYESSWITTELTFYFSGIVQVLLYELIFYPLLRNHVPYMQSYQWKLSVGVISQIAKVIAFMAIDLTARHSYIEHNNATIQCIFTEQSGILNSSFNMKWMILPQVFNRLLQSLQPLIAAFEIIYSQSPYSMRRLLFGVTYSSVLLYFAIGFGILQPFAKQSAAWGTGIISYEFWYLLLILLILILNGIMMGILMKWYKNRKREDVLPNEHVFAERYYTRNE